jgi:transposase
MTNYTQAQLRELATIGCDLGDKKSELFVIKADESTSRPKPVPTTREGFRAFFENQPKSHVVIEVGAHSRWASALLQSLGHAVTVANARRVELISKNDKKTDQVDARLLAKLGRADVDLLSPIRHRGEAVQADLAVAKTRDALVRCRTLLVNLARGLTKSFGYRLPKCDPDGFPRTTKPHVPELLEPALAPVYVVLEQISKQIKVLDKQVAKLAEEKYPDALVVSQIHGVGVLTGLVFVLTLEEKARFKKSRDVGPLLGLVPRRQSSGKDDPQLHITKAGDPFLRKLLVQNAQYVLGPLNREESDLRNWGLQLSKRGGKAAKKRACVAVARKLCTVMHRLWVTGEVYEPIGYRQKHHQKRTAAK